MEVRFEPEPTPVEEKALRAALARALDEQAPVSAWWRAGIAEATSTEAPAEPPGATL